MKQRPQASCANQPAPCGDDDARCGPETIWTIGHSTRTAEEFITALRSQEIAAVADVRKLPGSRKFPHFDQDALREALASAGLGYEHFPDLGGRRKPSPDSQNTAWRVPAFRAYAGTIFFPLRSAGPFRAEWIEVSPAGLSFGATG